MMECREVSEMFFKCVFRYDVELYQRIEHLIGKKLPLYKTEEEEVMQLMERVTEAQRYAKMVSVKNVRSHLSASVYFSKIFIVEDL